MIAPPPVLLIGAGRLGGALLDGWRLTGAVALPDLYIRARTVNEAARAAGEAGAVLNPPDAALVRAKTVVLGVKPLSLADVAKPYAALLAEDAVIVSLLVGVEAADVSKAFGGRSTVRVMPTTGIAIAKGVASLFSDDAAALAVAHALFDPVAVTIDLPNEGLMPAAAAVSGSGPAYLFAFVEALEAAALDEGLGAEAAATLARATVIGAAAHLDRSGADPGVLRRQVASPGGTTEAALKVLGDDARGLAPLLREAVKANISRGAEIAAAAGALKT